MRKARIISEGAGIHHLLVGGKDIWLGDDELLALGYEIEKYACLKGLGKW